MHQRKTQPANKVVTMHTDAHTGISSLNKNHINQESNTGNIYGKLVFDLAKPLKVKTNDAARWSVVLLFHVSIQ